MGKEEPIKISRIVSHNLEEFKPFKTHENCHIHFKDQTLDIIDCKIQRKKYFITCRAALNREKDVDFHWREHHLDPFKQTPACNKSKTEFKI